MTIRPAGNHDKPALGRIYCRSWQQAYQRIIPQQFLDALTEESCVPALIDPDSILVAEDGGAVFGLVSYGLPRDSSMDTFGELRAIYVLPEAWSRGYGRALLHAASERLQAAGHAGFYLWVLTQNQRARTFYSRNGLVDTGIVRMIEIGGTPVSETQYRVTF